jgi:L-aspartate oxidase
MNKSFDVIIVGTGAAGLFCALNLEEGMKILLITKETAERSDSFLAQGGICVLKNERDYRDYFEDTLRAGHYKNNRTSVDLMIRNSPEVIRDLIDYGVAFEHENGHYKFTREGAHSAARILFHEDSTGREITGKLLAEVRKRKNITLLEHTTMIDLVCNSKSCRGIVACNLEQNVEQFHALYIVLATGGVGGLYESSTNFPHITGDAIAIALKHQIELQDLNYIQIHPTTLYSKKNARRFLISESVRGEGALLYNAKMERFVDELLPRDLLTEAILKQMKADGRSFVWLSMKEIGREEIENHFPNIYRHCLEEGYDVTRECIPVVPAQHYHMGGIKVNSIGETSLERLYAIGEAGCNGVHGANRLASNSLLEVLVFAKRSAHHISKHFESHAVPKPLEQIPWHANIKQLQRDYKKIILDEIERKDQYEPFGSI